MTLAATSWPLLEILAAAEVHLVKPSDDIADADYCLGHMSDDSDKSEVMQIGLYLRTLQRNWWEGLESSDGDAVHSFSRKDLHSEELAKSGARLQRSFKNVDTVGFECMPLFLQQVLMLCLATSAWLLPHPGHDPEGTCRSADRNMVDFLLNEGFAQNLLLMRFDLHPIFGLWVRFRTAFTHRFDVPFASDARLAEAFGLSLRAHGEPADADREPEERFSAAYRAFESLSTGVREGRGERPVAIVTLCWGPKMAERLPLWLRSAGRAVTAVGVLVLCMDELVLGVCWSSNPQPALCADARDWPRNGLSKLVALALCLRRGVDALWLDMDTVVLRDPVPMLKPMEAASDPSDRDLLIQVEADSWNCINDGLFVIRAGAQSSRYLGMWVSLVLGRPAGSDQSVLGMLLGLLPKMSFSWWAETEGLLDPLAGTRARALGPLRTPRWAGLEPRSGFVMPAEVSYGGFQLGRQSDIAVVHMLESFPREFLINSLYHDFRNAGQDVVNKMLNGLSENSGLPNDDAAWALINRSAMEMEGWLWRDCRTSYNHGR